MSLTPINTLWQPYEFIGKKYDEAMAHSILQTMLDTEGQDVKILVYSNELTYLSIVEEVIKFINEPEKFSDFR